jgi:hypothetical protein
MLVPWYGSLIGFVGWDSCLGSVWLLRRQGEGEWGKLWLRASSSRICRSRLRDMMYEELQGVRMYVYACFVCGVCGRMISEYRSFHTWRNCCYRGESSSLSVQFTFTIFQSEVISRYRAADARDALTTFKLIVLRHNEKVKPEKMLWPVSIPHPRMSSPTVSLEKTDPPRYKRILRSP